MNHEFSWQIFQKYSIIKSHENPSSWSQVVSFTRGQTDMMILIVAFCNFVNVSKNLRNKFQHFWKPITVSLQDHKLSGIATITTSSFQSCHLVVRKLKNVWWSAGSNILTNISTWANVYWANIVHLCVVKHYYTYFTNWSSSRAITAADTQCIMQQLQQQTVTPRKIQLFRREEKPNFKLISLKCEEAIKFQLRYFGIKKFILFLK
jgi:hypothetical protein